MVEISRQYPSGAVKAVQISQAVVFEKGTQPEHTKSKISLLICLSDLLNAWLFWFQTFGKFQYFSTFYAHTTGKMCLEVLTFKMAIKV